MNNHSNMYQMAYTNFAKNSPDHQKITSTCESNAGVQIYRNDEGQRIRTAFTYDQLVGLEREFEKCMFLHRTRRIQISENLGLNEKQVKIWFQNRRAKNKRLASVDNKITKPNHVLTYTKSVSKPVDAIREVSSCSSNELPVIRPLKAIVATDSQIKSQQLNTLSTRKFKPQVLVQLPRNYKYEEVSEESIDMNEYLKFNVKEEDLTERRTQETVDLQVINRIDVLPDQSSTRDNFDVDEFLEGFEQFQSSTDCKFDFSLNDSAMERELLNDIKDVDMESLWRYCETAPIMNEEVNCQSEAVTLPFVSISFEDMMNDF